MKLKVFLSLLTIVFFGILAGASIDSDGSLWGLVWFLIILFVIVFISALISRNNEQERRERVKAASQARKQREAEQAELYNKWYVSYVDLNGTPDKTITISLNSVTEVIHVHETDKKVYIQGKTYAFKDILGCTFIDSASTIKGKITSTTKSNTGSAVGRAIVGDLVAGPAGAIIGGTTGKKTTEFHQENDRIIHDYTVIINVDNISTPILRVHTGSNEKLTNEIVGLMNVIISRK